MFDYGIIHSDRLLLQRIGDRYRSVHTRMFCSNATTKRINCDRFTTASNFL